MQQIYHEKLLFPTYSAGSSYEERGMSRPQLEGDMTPARITDGDPKG